MPRRLFRHSPLNAPPRAPGAPAALIFTLAAAILLISAPASADLTASGKRPESSAAAAGQPPKIAPFAQRYAPRRGQRLQPGAIVDADVVSPKSINFYPGGGRVYVNALEGLTTLVYSFPELKKLAVISHTFGPAEAGLFKGGEETLFDYQYYSKKGAHNTFSGKPVEGAFSRDGKFFFVPYYRRDFDRSASDPSAMAVIDAASDKIVRVLPTGPLPKMVAASPDGKILAVTHWGDNTIALLDTSSGDPGQFHYAKHLTVEPRLSTKGIGGNRDSNCGHCLRGTAFTPDGKHLLVGRMAGGGIAVFSMPDGGYLGGFTAFAPAPRHLVIDSRGVLYASDSRHGNISRVPVSEALESLRAAPGRLVPGPRGESLRVGSLPRTIALSPDERVLYAALHGSGELIQIDLSRFAVTQRVSVSPRPVGLGVSPDGGYVGLTSQGGLDKSLSPPDYSGGNSFEIYQLLSQQP